MKADHRRDCDDVLYRTMKLPYSVSSNFYCRQLLISHLALHDSADRTPAIRLTTQARKLPQTRERRLKGARFIGNVSEFDLDVFILPNTSRPGKHKYHDSSRSWTYKSAAGNIKVLN